MPNDQTKLEKRLKEGGQSGNRQSQRKRKRAAADTATAAAFDPPAAYSTASYFSTPTQPDQPDHSTSSATSDVAASDSDELPHDFEETPSKSDEITSEPTSNDADVSDNLSDTLETQAALDQDTPPALTHDSTHASAQDVNSSNSPASLSSSPPNAVPPQLEDIGASDLICGIASPPKLSPTTSVASASVPSPTSPGAHRANSAAELVDESTPALMRDDSDDDAALPGWCPVRPFEVVRRGVKISDGHVMFAAASRYRADRSLLSSLDMARTYGSRGFFAIASCHSSGFMWYLRINTISQRLFFEELWQTLQSHGRGTEDVEDAGFEELWDTINPPTFSSGRPISSRWDQFAKIKIQAEVKAAWQQELRAERLRQAIMSLPNRLPTPEVAQAIFTPTAELNLLGLLENLLRYQSGISTPQPLLDTLKLVLDQSGDVELKSLLNSFKIALQAIPRPEDLLFTITRSRLMSILVFGLLGPSHYAVQLALHTSLGLVASRWSAWPQLDEVLCLHLEATATTSSANPSGTPGLISRWTRKAKPIKQVLFFRTDPEAGRRRARKDGDGFAEKRAASQSSTGGRIPGGSGAQA